MDGLVLQRPSKLVKDEIVKQKKRYHPGMARRRITEKSVPGLDLNDNSRGTTISPGSVGCHTS